MGKKFAACCFNLHNDSPIVSEIKNTTSKHFPCSPYDHNISVIGFCLGNTHFIFPLLRCVFIKPKSPGREKKKKKKSIFHCQSTRICVKYERGQRQCIVAGVDKKSRWIKLFWCDPTSTKEKRQKTAIPCHAIIHEPHIKTEICSKEHAASHISVLLHL